MKHSALKILSLLLAAAMVFGLTACAKESAPAATAAPSEEPSPAVEETPTIPTPEPDTPAARAAAKGLPEPPDIDIYNGCFLIANSYNSIAEYELGVNYCYFAGQGMDKRAAPAIRDFLNAAKAEGYGAYISVGYRNYEWLVNHYNEHVAAAGTGELAAKVFLGPGVNDHQTGFSVDFTDREIYAGIFSEYDASGIEETELYSWLCEHCVEYGLILRYPEGKEDYYGTACNCAAHFRYVGVEAAEYITENGICLEEFVLLYDPDAVFVPEKKPAA